ncbi:MAG: SufE family protein, partial [Pseudomonadota bacterium]
MPSEHQRYRSPQEKSSHRTIGSRRPGGRLTIRAESDAMIVSGLISILTRLFSGQRVDEILSFDVTTFLEEIGISGALTAQRSNGL